jgi:hypothetical protein
VGVGGETRAAPDGRGEPILDVRVSLSDDAGTTYPLRSRSVGGTGRLFRGNWYFTAGVPEDAASVVIHVEGDNEQAASVTVDLREHS